MKKVVFLGLGYIGLPTAAVAAAHGFGNDQPGKDTYCRT